MFRAVHVCTRFDPKRIVVRRFRALENYRKTMSRPWVLRKMILNKNRIGVNPHQSDQQNIPFRLIRKPSTSVDKIDKIDPVDPVDLHGYPASCPARNVHVGFLFDPLGYSIYSVGSGYESWVLRSYLPTTEGCDGCG